MSLHSLKIQQTTTFHSLLTLFVEESAAESQRRKTAIEVGQVQVVCERAIEIGMSI